MHLAVRQKRTAGNEYISEKRKMQNIRTYAYQGYRVWACLFVHLLLKISRVLCSLPVL